MVEHIEREAVIAAMNKEGYTKNMRVHKAVLAIPAADVQPVRHGRWVEFPAALAYKNAYCDTHIVCSACEAVFDIMDNCTEKFNYCPECGAKMDGGE